MKALGKILMDDGDLHHTKSVRYSDYNKFHNSIPVPVLLRNPD